MNERETIGIILGLAKLFQSIIERVPDLPDIVWGLSELFE
jgi:hypothetical protein